MASDDLIRIVYRSARINAAAGAGTARSPKATPRRNRTSISMDPDLYQTFCLIEGDVRAARAKLRQWATEADGERQASAEPTGVSRLVHKRMLAKIREVVEAGLTVLQTKGATATGKAKPAADDAGAEWDNFQGSSSGREAKKAIKKAATAAKKAPGRKGKAQAVDAEVTGSGAKALADDAPGAGGGAAADAQVTVSGATGEGGGADSLAALPEAGGLVSGAAEYTRERLVEDGVDPFMG
ncbi:hypothetical protein [Methylibium petroleiphilum]|uniref:Uncharacterized protein n=1 Tax=Methylibium petroleiphilum (strain ATCC BAA-1232 / LMG 22953 / PM1) TaxID=420662 RepID=A2SMX0_METPP|nr:hypothetical protein [Methylibium petroleiphilum]ABM96909.1 hypothetical protein Mpe_B0130 [Methylibium petroleiphilum PM1]